jgi:hypothetical protein
MAEQRAQDVVNQTQSAGDASPSDAPATTSTPDIKVSGDGTGVVEAAPKENGIHTLANLKMDDLDDGSVRSDTDTSRAEGSVTDDKIAEPRPLKKFAAKPVSFAKYSVPKVIAASAAAKGTDKVATTSASASSLAQAGRPRLVAKTTSSLQAKASPYKTVTPDPMQVWNKNRITPQPSTKHLTDEELKQQYGIHLTSRIQADGEGKEAKWADIDDDEDDWAPETIEWNDGTKSTLTHAEAAPQATQTLEMPTEPAEKANPVAPPKILAPQFASSVGPNATVLKVGQSAERQQAQKAAIFQVKSPSDKPSLTSSKTAPAPVPSKSPWAPLPPMEKASPIAINPQMVMPPPNRFPTTHVFGQHPPSATAPSPAKEISADDFNRSWRDSAPAQPQLYMPNSGRYEAVPEGRRRMSRNDQNFRAPAVLQRPSHTDPHAPAEPSPAFQTHRTSMDQARRRASSTISGGSGQFGRRMSIRSAETGASIPDIPKHDLESVIPPTPRDDPASLPPTSAYQARGTNEQIPVDLTSASDADIETQRAQQRALMKENIERARRRKIEEEQRMEAEKQERIRAKLASLGLDPDLAKKKPEDASHHKEVKKDLDPHPISSTSEPGPAVHSPPKPPQPLASGEPQQYGMMKVHPMDSVKKMANSMSRPVDSPRLPMRAKVESASPEESHPEPAQLSSPVVNGARTGPELRRTSGQETTLSAEPSPKLPKPSSVGNDVRGGWGDVRHDHRSPQTANLWGVPNNKALGNGTFDQGLAGYAPQDLSRASSTAQGWMNGRTPHAGRSPQAQYVNHSLPDSRPFPYPAVASPDQPPLAADSEIDSLFPTTKPAPIGPPQSQQINAPGNGHHNGARPTGVEAWGNFHQAATVQERAENERLQREMLARREEELRTGVRQGPSYTFNETWKQVHVGDQAGQRHITAVAQSSVPASSSFGAVGSLAGGDLGPRVMNGPAGRGSRFFPQPIGAHAAQDRRAFTYSHPEPPRTPSPPPAEEYASLHPAFDGHLGRPVVNFPREKAVVRLPPALPPTPPSPVQAQAGGSPDAPISWAARVSMPPPTAPSPSLRSVSTPIVQNPSWQERFNGLLGKISSSPVREPAQPDVGAVLAVASSTREPLDVLHHVLVPAASVSLPAGADFFPGEDWSVSTKDVEDEDDLFEDREPGSLPAVNLPLGMSMMPRGPASFPSKTPPHPVEALSAYPFMVANMFERHGNSKPQFALIRIPGSAKAIKKDIPVKGQSGGGRPRYGGGGLSQQHSSSGSYPPKNPRSRGGPRSRHASKAAAAAAAH